MSSFLNISSPAFLTAVYSGVSRVTGVCHQRMMTMTVLNRRVNWVARMTASVHVTQRHPRIVVTFRSPPAQLVIGQVRHSSERHRWTTDDHRVAWSSNRCANARWNTSTFLMIICDSSQLNICCSLCRFVHKQRVNVRLLVCVFHSNWIWKRLYRIIILRCCDVVSHLSHP